MVSIKYHFSGTTTHAAAAPHAGRSALDAVELMNIGVNYMREHVLDGSRIHYVITNGGLAPNIVPDQASVWYFIRGASKEQVEEMLNRINKIAEGATLMTETKVETELLAFAYETLSNDMLNGVMFENMQLANSLSFTETEQSFAQALVDTVDPHVVKIAKNAVYVGEDDCLPTSLHYRKELKGTSMPGSSDVGDVSWITPLAQVMTTCAPVGVQLHSWQATSSFGFSIGFKGMHLAAKTMALTAYDLLLNENQLLEKVREEFENSKRGKVYAAGLPDDIKPPSIASEETTKELV